MRPARHTELPPQLSPVLRRAIVLEWVTIVFLGSVIVLMYLVMGTSQAMRTAWIEDCLSLIPPVVFLISVHFRDRAPNENYPYGYHRAVTIAFLIAAVALLSVGGYLLVDAIIKLIKREHPSIGTVAIFGEPIWLGWLMIPVLVWSVVPAVLLGRAKLDPASRLHDKTLYADANMNKADWMTGLAAMIGIMGIALGWWWADAAAAAVIALDIVHDGGRHVVTAIGDLMDRTPRTVDGREPVDLPQRISRALDELPWVDEAAVRLRENGHVFFGEVFLKTKGPGDAVERTRAVLDVAYGLDWRLQELVVQLTMSTENGKGKACSDEERSDSPGSATD